MGSVVVGCASVLLLGGCSTPAPTSPTPDSPLPAVATSAATPAEPTLPLGGREIFPEHRVVALYGAAGSGALGDLGVGTPDDAAARLARVAKPYETPTKPVLGVMELIVHVADPQPGPAGCYSHGTDMRQARAYLDAARRHRQMLVLDIQPGQCDFMSQTREWAPLLAEPDVGLALDAEWRMPQGAIPGQQVGTVDAAEVNDVSGWLAGIVRDKRLPQKLFVLHQFTPDMISRPETLANRPELAGVTHIDGFGSIPDKLTKYRELLTSSRFHPGFKLFFTEDRPMMTPRAVLGLIPPPEYISYQ
ncbi:hypothetical protein [Williamsia sterculiae]|uniref:Lipoprotein n=1 Tax=Williamsia sterculiae TaxID=1344003 RepID=A0A1N7H5J3_9NOCA|nr:hypothetical protein [Williamsia sterculiae]SIS20135.1 hypothetical protein SAMN05445060_3547 [Williamsia sterculiae]